MTGDGPGAVLVRSVSGAYDTYVSFDLTGKRVLVTGASSGIGAGLAEAFAGSGATVGICARREDRLKEVLDRCLRHQAGCRMWVADLSLDGAVDDLARSAVDELGGVDVLVNNAGIPLRRRVTHLDPATVEQVMRINFLSPVRLTLALLPHMLARGEGRIVQISSVAATLSSPRESAYDASKAALSAFSEAMAVDLWDSGVKVLIVYPGLFDTELIHAPDNERLLAPIPPAPVSELCDAVIEALGEDRLQVYVPGYFRELAATKASDPEAFLAGTAEFVRAREA